MNTWNDLSLSEKSEMMRVAIENGITTLPEIKEAYNQFALGGFEDNKPKFQKSSEAYYDPDSDTVFAPDSTGEYYYHELFHARPDNAYLQKIAPLYSDLNDEKLIQMGADLPFVKRFEGDPGHFYSPAEVGARRAAASYMLKQAGVKSIDDTFLNEARKDELKYGNNLFSGENEPTQQMNNGLNLYRRTNNLGETEYIYQETPDSEEILLTPTNKRFSDDPSNWDYKDANGREYTPRMAKPAVPQAELRPYEKDWYHKITEALGYDWLVNKSNKYYNSPILGAAARWATSYDNNTNPIKGLWNSPLAYGNVYSMAAKAADNLFLNPNGLQKTIALYNNSDGSYADRNAWQKSLLGDVVEASMISPAVREAYKSSEPLINASKTYLQNNYPAVFDPYTSWDATLGYHGDNIFSRALGTVGRRYGYTPKAEVPEFHRRLAITKPESFKLTDDGKFIMSSGRTGEGHEGIVNFATSEAARSHNKHKYLSGIDDFIVHPKALENANWKSIQPSDTFLEMPLDNSTLAIDPKYITFVSGEPEALNYARSIGMKTLSSPKLRALEASKPSFSGLLDRINNWKGAHSENARSIGNEIQRLTSMRGAPTMKDYAYFEDATGLNSGVVPSSQWTGINEESLFGRSSGVRGTPKFNNVAYDPATPIESIYRKAKTGEISWSDYYEALEKMPSARQQLGLNSAMDTYFGEPIVPEGYLTAKPQVRTKVGDVEIDNPQLAYRQGEGIVDDFIRKDAVEAATPPESNIVTTREGLTFDFTPQSFDLPMFSQGRPWYGIGKPKSKEMLVTAEPLSKSNSNGGLEPWKYNGTFDVRYDLGKPHTPGWLRRVPDDEQVLNTSNTSAYRWEPGYGYRRVFAEETPTADWPVSRAVPQITAENAVSMTPKVNWDADYWFKTISGRNSYSAEEAAELASHVLEYREIERRLFDEGKLTIDSKGDIIVNGSEMSPQEYIMRQSEAFQKMNPEHHYVGVSKK